jgi:hypothetical protein
MSIGDGGVPGVPEHRSIRRLYDEQVAVPVGLDGERHLDASLRRGRRDGGPRGQPTGMSLSADNHDVIAEPAYDGQGPPLDNG